MKNPFELNSAQLESLGARWTTGEILQQPHVWRVVREGAEVSAPGLGGFIDAALSDPAARVLLTGAGTSAFIGSCLAPSLARLSGRRVEAIPTTDIVAAPANCLQPNLPTLLVSFARSGNSPESLAALELAEQRIPNCRHLIFTCNPQGALHQRWSQHSRARVVLLPPETDDRGYAMTSSFTSMLLCAALAFRLPLARETTAADIPSDLLPMWIAHIMDLVAQRFERIVYLGAGELHALAREAALKMLELTDGKVVSIAETPLGFRHGPKTVVNARTAVVVLTSNDPYTRQYDGDLVAELRLEGQAGRVIALYGREGRSVLHADDLIAPELARLTDLGLCLPYAVFAQAFALMQSLSLSLRPDNPNATGAVSRVVRGFPIYPAGKGE